MASKLLAAGGRSGFDPGWELCLEVLGPTFRTGVVVVVMGCHGLLEAAAAEVVAVVVVVVFVVMVVVVVDVVVVVVVVVVVAVVAAECLRSLSWW